MPLNPPAGFRVQRVKQQRALVTRVHQNNTKVTIFKASCSHKASSTWDRTCLIVCTGFFSFASCELELSENHPSVQPFPKHGASPAAETSPLDLLFPSRFLLFGIRDGSAGTGREHVLRSLKQDRPSTPNLILNFQTDQRTRSRFVLQPYQSEQSGEESAPFRTAQPVRDVHSAPSQLEICRPAVAQVHIEDPSDDHIPSVCLICCRGEIRGAGGRNI